MINSGIRFFIIKLIIFLMMSVIIFRLFELQVVKGDEYREITRDRLNVNMISEAPRGQIYDRYATPLVTNRAGYSLQIFKNDLTDKEFNDMLLKLLRVLKSTGNEFLDTLPISDYPFEFIFETKEEKDEWFSENHRLKKNMSAEEVMEKYIYDIYHIPGNYTPEETRGVVGIRYELDKNGFSALNPVVIFEDIGVELVSAIKERQREFPCVMVKSTYYREYKNGIYASHVIGTTGKLNTKEYEEYKEDGYRYSDIIGKQGIEKYAEKYLRGTDGTRGIEKEVNSKKVTLVRKKNAVSGDSVILTIDINMQKVLEDSLENTIKSISQNGGKTTGEDANAGAGVVIDIKTGDVLACASYPTYDLSSFNRDYSVLLRNEAKPLWNRAVSGTYTPGSTFKPLVAISALQSKTVTVDEKINDEGIYRFYEDYQPKCWIWQENGSTHANINISDAIENSCNYFFYEIGRRTGIDKIAEYGLKFGLGELTGIELPEEVKGNIANPEYKKKVVKNQSEKRWFGADTLQASIGQSYHAITPVQLANYAATIANGGTRYKVNLIKNIRSAEDNSIVIENKPTVICKIDITEENLNAVKEGMKNVVDEGSAQAIFKDYPIKIGGKTGTAQLGKNVSNNAFFIAFAPFEDPEIAICVAIEHGVRGANAAYVARDVFDYYFKIRG